MRYSSLFLLLAAILIASCASENLSAEQQIRRFIDHVETVAEDRDVEGLDETVSEQYYDGRKQTKRTIAALTRFYLGAHKSVHVLSSIREIVLTDSTHAQARIVVGLAGSPIENASALSGLGADIYMFDVKLTKEGSDWRVSSAEWERATPGDFLAD